MIEEVINYINKENEFLKSEGYCFLQETNDGVFIPHKKHGKEFKPVHNFDKLKDFSYWRVVGQVDIEAIQNDYSVKKLFALVYPCKLVFVSKGLFTDDKQALNVISSLATMKKINREDLDVYNISLNFINYEIDKYKVAKDEFGDKFNLPIGFNFMSFNVNIVITVDQNCISKC